MRVKDKNHIRILVVDDEPGMRNFLSMELSDRGYQVTTAADGEEALRHIQKEKYRLVISDLKMPKMDGITLLERVKEMDPLIEVIITTAYATVETAVETMKKGAYDYILKPFNMDELNILIGRALEKRRLQTTVAFYESSRAIFSTIRLNELFEIVMDLIQKALGADEGSLMLLDEANKLYIATSRGLSGEWVQKTHLSMGERIAGYVAQEKQGLLLINGLDNYPEFRGLESNPRILSSIISPLICRGELLGVLNVSRTHRPENFTEEDLHVATIFASQVALAIQNAKFYEALETKVREIEEAYRRLEETQTELVKSEKLASVGRLISGVAHELNNPLTAVIGYCEMAKKGGNFEEIREQLTIISEQADRCVNTVKDLLIFARGGNLVLRPVNPLDLIEDSLKGVSIELEKRNIHVERNYPSEPGLILADSHQIKRAFTNILTNAYQALEQVSRERIVTITVKAESEKAEILFSDNGPGISKENLCKIFDPFFTTKELGQGTGLGLSLSYGIIKDHGGNISVRSEQEEGTTLSIELPTTDAPVLSTQEVPEERKVLSTRMGQAPWKFLLVEDEKPLQTLIERILSDQHCQLEVASDGEVALEKIRERDYDLILCDYRIPKLNGVMLFKAVEKIKPEITRRFIFISGSIGFIQNADFFKTNRVICLAKPFAQDELMNAIVSALERSEPEEMGGVDHDHDG